MASIAAGLALHTEAVGVASGTTAAVGVALHTEAVGVALHTEAAGLAFGQPSRGSSTQCLTPFQRNPQLRSVIRSVVYFSPTPWSGSVPAS